MVGLFIQTFKTLALCLCCAEFVLMTSVFYTPLDEALFKSRIIQISGPVDSELAYDTNKKLLALEADNPQAPIYLHVDSPGGVVTSGFAIFDMARFVAPEVITVVMGLAASAGSLISLCASKKNRVAFPNAKFLIHQPLISGVLRGSASDLEIHAKDIIATRRRINEIYAEETGRSLEEIEKATDRDNWMTAVEALEFGLIDRIVKSRKEL